jgi:hypothetical protein
MRATLHNSRRRDNETLPRIEGGRMILNPPSQRARTS